MSEKATYFNESEHQICLVASMIEDARMYWGPSGNSAMAAIMPATIHERQSACYQTEYRDVSSTHTFAPSPCSRWAGVWTSRWVAQCALPGGETAANRT